MMSTEHGQFDRLQGSKPVSFVHSHNPSFLLIALALVSFLALSSGCRQIYLPRIDPTGANVFLPFPNTTELEISASPAFQQPVAPPACVDGTEGGVCNLFNKKLIGHVHKSLHKSPGECGEIQLTPMRVVAPVGGEVVLLAGICGEDGYLVKREPIEWMLSPDSVGTFIEVGDDATSRLISTLRRDPRVEKLDVDFARGRTSNKETLITRGTPGTVDDIQLKNGQTWLSISSPSEGVSRVTVLAPDSELWDRRRQTAMIYWVDAQWEFPQPQVANSGEPIQLLTRVTKSGDVFKPAAGWKVIYTIVDPSVAAFAPINPAEGNRVVLKDNQASVTVDQDGQARVLVTAPIRADGKPARGTTPVLVEVYRPRLPEDDLPEILLGSGQTVVTFSSAGLELQAVGPREAAEGEQLTYNAVLANPGDRDAENVKLLMRIPAGMQFIAATPQARQYQDNLVWDQGVLAAQRQLDVSVVLQANQIGDYQVAFSGSGEPNLRSDSSVSTSVIQPSVRVRFEPTGGNAQAEIGSQKIYEIDVTNTGRQTLTDLKVVIESAPGLPEAEGGKLLVDWVIAMLQPGQTVSRGIAFSVQREGQLPVSLKVLSGSTVIATQASTVFGTPAAEKVPGIDVSVSFPESVTVGSRTRAIIALKNTGRTNLTGIRVAITSDPALRAVATDAVNKPFVRPDATGLRLEWTPQDMMPGTDGDTIAQLYIEYEAQAPVAQAAILVQATSNERVQDQAQVTTIIVSSGNQLGTQQGNQPPATGGTQQRSGSLRITLNDFEDPTNVGKTFRYGLGVTNNQNLGDRNIRIQLKMPPEIELLGVSMLTGNNVAFSRVADGVFEFQTEKFLGPGQELQYVLTAKGVVAREQAQVSARVYSDEQPTPQEVTTTTTINQKLQ